mmetsp:Transcript_24371/g.53676  ORF Transcript_24371/g.53676 Transcript_24371/m.53676 type:complete len:93 (+) Transcript_24371:42-320(+)
MIIPKRRHSLCPQFLCISFVCLLHADELSYESVDGFKVEDTLSTDEGLQTDRGGNTGFTDNTRTKKKDESSNRYEGYSSDEVDAEFVLPSVV